MFRSSGDACVTRAPCASGGVSGNRPACRPQICGDCRVTMERLARADEDFEGRLSTVPERHGRDLERGSRRGADRAREMAVIALEFPPDERSGCRVVLTILHEPLRYQQWCHDLNLRKSGAKVSISG